MTDDQCVALMATMLMAASRQQLSNKKAAETAADILTAAREAWSGR